MTKKLNEFEKIISYNFRDMSLLKTALTHPSYSAEAGLPRSESNQRLEFLGDAVLELVVSDYLYTEYPGDGEGDLTKKRASLVFETALFMCAKKINLGNYLYLGVGETQSRGFDKPSILADAFEAVTGAIYLDGGIDEARRFLRDNVLCRVDDISLISDGKSLIQKYVQRSPGDTLQYETIPADGRDDDAGFKSSLYINGVMISEGSGRSKKSAEQEAALAACRIFNIK